MNLTKTLVEAIQTEITTNPTLSYVNSAFIVPALSGDYVYDFWPEAPFCLIYPAPGSTFTPISLPNACEDGLYRIGVSFFEEFWGRDTGVVGDSSTIKGVAEVESDLQEVFNRNTFSIAGLFSAKFTGASYSPVGFTRIADQSISQVHCALEYSHAQYSQARSLSEFWHVMTPSGDTAAVAGTTIEITHGIQRLYGTGGVTMTALPTLSQGVDGQVAVLQGTDDTNRVTVQDSSNLTGSGLRLVHARDFTLGRNDTLMLFYDAGESAWIELSRSDNY